VEGGGGSKQNFLYIKINYIGEVMKMASTTLHYPLSGCHHHWVAAVALTLRQRHELLRTSTLGIRVLAQ
jgi:hypothetical protein